MASLHLSSNTVSLQYQFSSMQDMLTALMVSGFAAKPRPVQPCKQHLLRTHSLPLPRMTLTPARNTVASARFLHIGLVYKIRLFGKL